MAAYLEVSPGSTGRKGRGEKGRGGSTQCVCVGATPGHHVHLFLGQGGREGDRQVPAEVARVTQPRGKNTEQSGAPAEPQV